MRILGIDPGLRNTGWGIIESQGSTLRLIDCGCIQPPTDYTMSDRLAHLYTELAQIVQAHELDAAAIEETFVNKNPKSTLKLGAARGVAMMTPASLGLPVAEYAANSVKKSVVGVGHAKKEQVMDMVHRLLPGIKIKSEDTADALAVAICHAHHAHLNKQLAAAMKESA